MPSDRPENRLPPCRRVLLSILVAALHLAGCGEDADGIPGEVRRDSAGVEVVRHPSLSGYDGPVHRPEYLLGIGADEGPEEYVFGRIGDAAVLSDGSVAVLDQLHVEVRLYSPEGEFTRTIGGRGEGPGEFSGSLTLALIPLEGGRFAVPDLGNGAVTTFDSAGNVESTIRFDGDQAVAPEWRALSGDTLVFRSVTANHEHFVARTLDGRWQDTLAVLDRIRHGPTEQDRRWPLMADHWVWSARGRGFAAARMSRPAVAVYQESAPARVISWAGEGAAPSDADTDTLLRIVARNEGITGEIPQNLRDAMRPPERIHLLADVELGPDGVVMVQRLRPLNQMDRRILSTTGARGFGGRLWDLFSRSGSYLGSLLFDANVEVFGVQGDTIVGAQDHPSGASRLFLARLPDEFR